MTIYCPKCGFEQEQQAECINCGIIFKRYEERKPVPPKLPTEPQPENHDGNVFRTLRIIILLTLLVLAGGGAIYSKMRTSDWDRPLYVKIYPINGDNSEVSAKYIKKLNDRTFAPIEKYFITQGQEYKLPLEESPIKFQIMPEVTTRPPQRPTGAGVLKTMLWSLKLRYWAYKFDPSFGPAEEVQMFVLFYDPKEYKQVETSLGLQKGLIGVVHGFASFRLRSVNNMIIAHELLHTVGASDKYDLTTGQPYFPDGYADPEAHRLYPQKKAELMGRSIPLSETESELPRGLYQTIIGPLTAKEINWIK